MDPNQKLHISQVYQVEMDSKKACASLLVKQWAQRTIQSIVPSCSSAGISTRQSLRKPGSDMKRQ